MKKIRCILSACLLLAGASQAATIEWGGASTISGASDVSTSGSLEYAYHAGGTSAVFLNGVVFAAGSTTFGGDVTLSGTPAIASIFGQNAAPFNTLVSDYQSLLDVGVYNNVGNKTQPVTVTLNNLTSGQQYEVQVWGNDSRNSSGRFMTVAGGTNTVSVDYNSTDALGGVGQYVLGTLIADASTQEFTLTPNVSLSLNAIQVRDVTPAAAPIDWIGGAGSADWNDVSNWSSVELPGSTQSEPVLFSGAEDHTILVSPFAFAHASDINVQAGTAITIQSELSGVGAFILGGEDGLAGGAVIQSNGTVSADSLTVSDLGELSFKLGASGVNAIQVNALTVSSLSARLMVDVSSYTGTETSIELVQCSSMNGSFGADNILITGLTPEQEPGAIIFDGDSLNLVFGEVSTYQTELDTVLALGDLTNAPALYTTNYVATTWADVKAEIIASGDSVPIFYEGLDYNGHSTRIFAWVGLPADLSGPVPAVVLAHGAGSGTAYKTWVDLWNARGYAAIAMDFNAKMSDENGNSTALSSYRGPVQDGRYNNSVSYPAVALTNHWMYHCVADAVLANSLLRSMPEVNEDQVGMMGVSWGGTITSTTIGIDTRLAFAVPTYGCGHLYDSYSLYSHLADCELYKQVWDPMVRIDRATMPVLWYSWPTDPHFPVDCQAENYLNMSGEHMVTLIPGMTHNHPAAWNREDSYSFADSVISNGTPWCKQQSLELNNNVAIVTFVSTKTLDGAALVSTTGTGYAGDLSWPQSTATLVNNGDGTWTVTATLPNDTTGWFVNIMSDTLVVSSDYQEIINLISDQMELNHSIYANQSTGRVDVAFTAPTNVEIVDVRIGYQSHAGAITNVTVAPFVETSAYPSTFPIWIEFDNTEAGLSDGETATATLTLVWHELDGTTDQIELPIQVTAYTTLHAEVDIFSAATTDYGSNTVATMVSEVLTAPDGLATFQIKFDVTPMTAGSSINSGYITAQTTSQSWGIAASGETGGAIYTFDGDTAEIAEPINNLQVINFNAHGGNQTSNDITGLSFKSVEIANGNHAQDRIGILINSGEYENLGSLSDGISTIDLEGLAGGTPPVINLAIKPMSTSGSNRFTVNSIKVKYTVALSADAYSTWASGYGLFDDDALPAADVENGGIGDGYNNLVEFALGMNPTNSDAGSKESVSTAVDGGINYFEYVHNRRSDHAEQGLFYLLIDTTNLVNSSFSTNAQDQISVGPENDGYEPVTNRYVTDEPAQFIQLNIQQD